MRLELEGHLVMTKLMRRFMLCRKGVTAIEYALLGSGIALAIITGRQRRRHQPQRGLHQYRQRVSMR